MNDGPIETYLDRLFVELRQSRPRDARWILAEAEAHLRDAANEVTVAIVIFGVSGAWMAGLAVDAMAVSSGHGSGQWLSAALVALAAASVFGTRLLRDLSAQPLSFRHPVEG